MCNCMHQHLHTLKIPNIGSHTIVWMHENTTHTLAGPGRAALADAVALRKEAYIYLFLYPSQP